MGQFKGRRELLEKVGGFHELLTGEEDWDLLKRFARLGVDFVFLKGKAGTLHVRIGSESAPKLTERGTTPAGMNPAARFPKKVERVLFALVDCLLDYTNGASLAALQAFRRLQVKGFQTEAFCLCDHTDPATQHLGAASQQRAGGLIPPGVRGELQVELERRQGGGTPAGMNPAARFGGEAHQEEYETVAAGIPVTVRRVEQNDPWLVTGETRTFLAVYERLLAEQRPDVVVTYGGDCLSLATARDPEPNNGTPKTLVPALPSFLRTSRPQPAPPIVPR